MGLGMNEIIEAFDGKLSRRFLLVLAVIMGITAYLYVVEFYHPNQNLVRQIWRGLGPPKSTSSTPDRKVAFTFKSVASLRSKLKAAVESRFATTKPRRLRQRH